MMGDQRNNRERSTLLRAMGVVSACGLDLALSVLVGVLAGLFVDARLHSSPWGLLVGLFAGLIVGVYTVYRIIAPIVRSM
jgi:F0F1-type ATP synthase assembly protein I